jgi:hypothetical protein
MVRVASEVFNSNFSGAAKLCMVAITARSKTKIVLFIVVLFDVLINFIADIIVRYPELIESEKQMPE